MVEHKGFEPLASSMPWKRASQLRQCPLNRGNCTSLRDKNKVLVGDILKDNEKNIKTVGCCCFRHAG